MNPNTQLLITKDLPNSGDLSQVPERQSANDSMTSSKFYYERCREISHRYPDAIGVPVTHDVMVTIKKPTSDSPFKIRDVFNDEFKENSYNELKKDNQIDLPYRGLDYSPYKSGLKQGQNCNIIGSPKSLKSGGRSDYRRRLEIRGDLYSGGKQGGEGHLTGRGLGLEEKGGREELPGRKIEELLKEGDLVFGDSD